MKNAAHRHPACLTAIAVAVGCAVIGAAPGIASADAESGASGASARGGAAHRGPARPPSEATPAGRRRSAATLRSAAATELDQSDHGPSSLSTPGPQAANASSALQDGHALGRRAE